MSGKANQNHNDIPLSHPLGWLFSKQKKKITSVGEYGKKLDLHCGWKCKMSEPPWKTR
jgi:hypothetical protein